MNDVQFMNLAILEAKKGQGRVSPNPRVGAILVKNGKVLARGYHHQYGGDHAEIDVFRNLHDRPQLIKGSTLYVTLEPCSTYAKTPPCVEAIISKRLSKVVVGSIDPNPVHQGRGIRQLMKKGIHVITGVAQDETDDLIKGFRKWIRHNMPYCTVKAAISLDGKIATCQGQSKWITGEAARILGYKMRRDADAVLVGIRTVLMDDPKLSLHGAGIEPYKIILDPSAKLPKRAIVVRKYSSRVIIVVSDTLGIRRQNELESWGLFVVRSKLRKGQFHLQSVMKALGRRGITSILVEGGGETIATFFEQEIADEICFFYAKRLIGGRNSPTCYGGKGVSMLFKTPRLRSVAIKDIGSDFLVSGKVVY